MKTMTKYAKRKLRDRIGQLMDTIPQAGAIVAVKRGVHYGKLGLVDYARIIEFNYQGYVGVTGPAEHPKLRVLISSTERIWLHPSQVDQIDLDYFLKLEWMRIWYQNWKRKRTLKLSAHRR